ncbi:ATP-grasp fold amidoligase family protein [Virgibacillus doumboii]|uniref:ATP-grasp fold amidoligase family protein n=1 Tax=Virgibacillus doumboii TaxID=2697503 RepID=UPI0013E035CE|nr:ATP-grasp fold amidoligase family protein [Virgibacillus doumboii]
MLTIKKKLKKISVIKNVQAKFIALFVKLSPYAATKYLYKKNTGKRLDLKNPRDFNEKIQWLKLYWEHPLVPKCGDKYEVRKFAEEMGCYDVLIETYGVYDDTSEIDWDMLPQKFAIKVTSGCGFNIICEDKETLDKKAAIANLNKWMKVDYGLERAEIHYSKMTPRILCEKFIETNDGKLPIDYKFFCFNGEPEFILVAMDRGIKVKRFLFDLEWKSLDFQKVEEQTDKVTIEKPQSFRDMVYYAGKLAKPFPFVRVDFYDFNGKAVLGEMTFTPDRGMATHYNEKILHKFGDMIKLPAKI